MAFLLYGANGYTGQLVAEPATPSQAFGPDFAATLPGVSVKVG